MKYFCKQERKDYRMADNNTPFSVRMEQEDKEKLIQLIQDRVEEATVLSRAK